MSDDPPGFNSPRRKARFGADYEQDIYRRRIPAKPAADEGPAAEPALEPETGARFRTKFGPPPTPRSAEPETTSPDETVEKAPSTAPGGEAAPETDDGLLPNFQLNRVYEMGPPQVSALKDWRWLLVTAALCALGIGGGYRLGLVNASAKPKAVPHEVKPVLDGLTPELQAQVDEAFTNTKRGRFVEASGLFAELYAAHPNWWSMGIEAARASLYTHEPQVTQRALDKVTNPMALADVDFIKGLLHMTTREFALAEDTFASATAREPGRTEFYYFWGECLRRDGKPMEAANKFRSALLRNQYENVEGLYQTKLWLSLIQADAAESSGANKEINEALASARPPYEAFFAAAARELKAKRYPEAVQFLAKAVPITEPAVFRAMMQDPTFVEEANVHPEFAPFYQ